MLRCARYVTLLLGTLCLMGCGFHLRGTNGSIHSLSLANLATPLHRLYLKTDAPYSPLIRNLQDYLKLSGIQLTESPTDASAVLEILKETTSQQILSVSSNLQTRQYNLILSVTFQITSPTGDILIPPQTLSETRVLTTQSSQILGGSNEATTLYQQMRPAIVYDIMNRLTSREIREQLMKPKKPS